MKTSLVVLGLVSFCLAAAQIVASPLEFGSLDDEAKEKHEKAREVMESLGMGININDEDIVKIGGGVAIDEDEVIEGDVVVIGGGLTVEGTIKGDAVVIGGSMYLASTAFVGKDAGAMS
jgi:NDP-sugar pyrophosphorylase family protein